MAKLPTKNTFASETVDFFRGIDRTSGEGTLSDAFDMANMRIQPDGSLIRREGYSAFMQFPSPIRCVAPCPTNQDYLFVLSGEILYSVTLSLNKKLELARGFNLYAPAFFFRLQDSVYLFSEGWCEVRTNELIYKDGYVPLVGKDWGADGGPVYEQQNMLAFNIRIDYLLDRDTNVIYTGYDLSEINEVYVNGKTVTGATIEQKKIRLPAVFPAGTRILLCLSLALSEIYDVLSLLACTSAYSCGHGLNSTAVLYNGEEPTRLFFITHAPEDKVAEAQVYFPDSGNIYCPAAPTHVKGLTGGVRAVCGEPDCLIVAGQCETRRLTPEGDTPIPGMEGCDSASSVAYFDGTAYVATPKGIWSLPLRGGKAEIISGPLGDLMGSDISKHAMLFYNVYREELWVKNNDMYNSTVYIYDPARKTWISFTNINAQGFFQYAPERSVGYWSELQMVRFVNDQNYDVPPGGNRFAINSYYISRLTCLGKPDRPKRLRRAKLTHTGASQVIALMLDDTGGLLYQHIFEPVSGIRPTFSNDPIRSNRADRFQVALFSDDQAPLQIHEFTLSAIK